MDLSVISFLRKTMPSATLVPYTQILFKLGIIILSKNKHEAASVSGLWLTLKNLHAPDEAEGLGDARTTFPRCLKCVRRGSGEGADWESSRLRLRRPTIRRAK